VKKYITSNQLLAQQEKQPAITTNDKQSINQMAKKQGQKWLQASNQ